ncbi:MAG: HAD hydrolase-like protein [Oligoflexia bacterium]|nr:HAD hydrolase-like protein [Oligoflexia bacterium]
MERRDITAVVFDMDGTLIDTTGQIVSALSAALKNYGIEPAVEESKLGMLMGRTLQDTLSVVLPGDKIKYADLVAGYYIDYYYKNFTGKASAYPYVAEVLGYLSERGCKIAVATTKHTDCAISEIDGAGLAGFIDVIEGTDPGIPHKPDPFLYFRICDFFSVAPGSTVMVGDSGRDIEFGKNAGAGTVAVTYGAWQRDRFISESIVPDIFIDNIKELLICL